MLRLTLFEVFFHLCLNIVAAEDCVLDYQSKDLSWEVKLSKDLKCNHDVFEPPQNNTDVQVNFLLKYFDFDKHEEVLSVQSWLYIGWSDDRLKWNESDYQGISEIVFMSHEFWIPTIRTMNEIDFEEYGYYYGQCTATSIGYVSCVPRILLETVCNTKIRNWPYDTQNCTLKFGAWTRNYNITFLFSATGGVTLLGAEYGSKWTIVDYDTGEQEDKMMQLQITFVLEREAADIIAVIVVPTIVVTVLVISTFLLDIRDNIRLGMIGFSLLCHNVLIMELNELIPKHSEDIPTIVYYLNKSVYINIFILMFTLYLSKLCDKNTSPPDWIMNVKDRILKINYSKYIIWSRWDVDFQREESERLAQQHWNDFVNILNSFCFALVIVIYVFHICFYMPRPYLVKY